MGLNLTQRSEFPAATAEFRTALEIDRTLARAHMGLGVALASSHRDTEAARAFEDAVRYDPSSVEAH